MLRIATLVLVASAVAGFQPAACGRRCRRGARAAPRAEPPGGAGAERGKQAKGFYLRPSAAVERGGGFFIPGLEGFRVRVAIAVVTLALLAFNHATSGDSLAPVPVSLELAWSL